MRAMVLDTSVVQRQFLTWVLREFKGLETYEADSLRAALALMDHGPYELIIIEQQMRDTEGQSALKALRSVASWAQILAVANNSDAASEIQAYAMGADAYLAKPATAIAVRDAASKLLPRVYSTPPEHEARVAARLNVPVSVTIDGVTMVTANISMFGAFIISPDPLHAGAQGKLALKLPHLGNAIELAFCVVHTRSQTSAALQAGFGVRFAPDMQVTARLAEAFSTPMELDRTSVP